LPGARPRRRGQRLPRPPAEGVLRRRRAVAVRDLVHPALEGQQDGRGRPPCAMRGQQLRQAPAEGRRERVIGRKRQKDSKRTANERSKRGLPHGSPRLSKRSCVTQRPSPSLSLSLSLPLTPGPALRRGPSEKPG